MPFTPAHAAAVLPLGRTALPMSALVAGSVAPDLPMFLPGRPGYEVTHSLWGVVTVDVLVAMAALWLWFGLVRDPYADVVPWVRDRVPAATSLTRTRRRTRAGGSSSASSGCRPRMRGCSARSGRSTCRACSAWRSWSATRCGGSAAAR